LGMDCVTRRGVVLPQLKLRLGAIAGAGPPGQDASGGAGAHGSEQGGDVQRGFGKTHAIYCQRKHWTRPAAVPITVRSASADKARAVTVASSLCSPRTCPLRSSSDTLLFSPAVRTS